MSDDIARLGLQIDSRPAAAASAELDKFARSATGASARIQGLATSALPANASIARFASLASAATSPTLLLATTVAGLAYKVGTDAVRAFQTLQLEQATYNAVLRATGFAAGKTANDIEDLANSIRGSSLATEGEVRSASAILLTFRSVAGDAFDETLRLSQDLAAVGFGSITSAATMMGKALEDPTAGLTALRRVGVSFNETQKAQIKNFLETGQAAKAQQVILEGVRKQVGGAGAAQGNTLAGAWNQLGEATNNWLERKGETISAALGIAGAIRGIAGAIDAVNNAAKPENMLGALRSERSALRGQLEGAGRIQRRQAAGRVGTLNSRIWELEADTQDAAAGAAYRKRAADAGQLAAAEQRAADQIEGTIAQIKRENDELKKSTLQRQIDKALKEAVAGTDGKLTEAQRKDIETRVKQNFYLQEGAGLFQQYTSLLGSLASTSDIVRAKEQEIIAARKGGTRITREEGEALKRLTELQVESSRITQAAQFGIFDGARAAANARLELQTLIDDGTIRNTEQYAAALSVSNKNIRELAESAAVARSPLEQLTRYALDGQNHMKQLDGIAFASVGHLENALVGMANGTKTAKEAFREMTASILSDIARMIIRMQLARLVGLAFGSFGGGGSIVSQAGPSVGFAVGGAHSGAIVGSEATFTRYVHPAHFNDAPRFHSGGTIGADEVPIIAKRGEGVFTPGQMKALAPVSNSAPPVSVTIQQTNTFTNADPNSEARMRAWARQTKDMAVKESVAAVANVRSNNPATYLNK